MLNQDLIQLQMLADYVTAAIPQAWEFDIDPAELQQHLAELRHLHQG